MICRKKVTKIAIQSKVTVVVMVVMALVVGCQGGEPAASPGPATDTPYPTNTRVPPTSTSLPTDTPVPPTETAPPTDAPNPPTASPAPTDTPARPTVASVTTTQPDGTGTVNDIDGNIYALVKIGDQWWMAESLNVTRNPSGETITGVCYDQDESNCEIYGRLYTWDMAMNGSAEEGAQGICPDGWHIPSDAEWMVLFEYLGGESVAGGAMKTMGTAHWHAPNTGATNASGFNGLPAGSYNGQRDLFEGLGIGVHFWSSTENGSNAGLPTLHSEFASVLLLNETKTISGSIRCVMD